MIADIDAAAGSESAAQIEQAGGSAAFVETDVGLAARGGESDLGDGGTLRGAWT